ncbi:hypothetical protein BGW80DRAFT_34021 [Lactifluus volemus]|nr:hypothetical protein BGW80DRAFT_34021 [Lactifluus volemus]
MSKRKLASEESLTKHDPAGASGPSSQPKRARIQTSSPNSKKRPGKGVQGSDATSQERRGTVFKKSCPQKILERVARVMSQRFFMIDRRREGDELHEEFKVLGSTGNVYTVVISKFPSCDCPDASRGNHCKHILFIFLKVLQVSQSSGLWYQKALLASELQAIFANAPQAPNAALAHERVRNAYAHATGEAPISGSSAPTRRIPGPEDSCPICYESMHDISQERLVFCEECGNALHSECFEQWRRSAAQLTCVWCRAKWQRGDKNESGVSPSRMSGAYVNLGEVAGLTGERDTSTYHRSVRYKTNRA